MHIDEVERLLEQDLPPGDYQTIGGLVIARLGRLPDPATHSPCPCRRRWTTTGRAAAAQAHRAGRVDHRVPATLDLAATAPPHPAGVRRE